MLSRTTTSLVTFVHPFVAAGYKDELPPGSYELLAEDEVMQSHSFLAYRRIGIAPCRSPRLRNGLGARSGQRKQT